MPFNPKRSAAELALLSVRLEELALETLDVDTALATRVLQLKHRVEGILAEYTALEITGPDCFIDTPTTKEN